MSAETWRRAGSRVALLLIPALVFLVVLACLPAIDLDLVRQITDTLSPVIVVLTPEEGAYYAIDVTVRGSVAEDSASADDGFGTLAILSYELVGTGNTFRVPFDESNGFSFSFSTRGLSGEIQVRIVATDANGNTAERTLRLLDDDLGPQIRLSSPDDESPYSATVIVRGVVSNSAEDTGHSDVKSLRYDVLSSPLGGELGYEEGSFQFSFVTDTFAGPITVRVTAEDWNLNTTEAFLTLVDAGNSIPSFRAQPGNHKVTLDWQGVPLSDGYTLYYTDNGSLPSEHYGTTLTSVSPGLVLDGLANGRMYVFLLQSHSTSGQDNWSAYERAIPLSGFTLAPRVFPAREGIDVEWSGIPATDEYEVLRSEGRDEPGSVISGTLRATSFTDELAQPGARYYYRVRPSLEGSLPSECGFGEVSPLPGVWMREAAHLPIVWTKCVQVRGSYLYVNHGPTGANLFSVYDITDPDDPVECGTCSLASTSTWRLVLDGDYAYLTAANSIEIVSVEDPSDPVSIKVYDTGASVSGLAVSSGYAFLGNGTAGFRILSVADPSNPVPLGSLPAHYSCSAVAVSGNCAYVSDFAVEIRVIDVTNKSLPAEVQTYTNDDFNGQIVDLLLSGSYLYASTTYSSGGNNAGGGGPYVFDVSTPVAPLLRGWCFVDDEAYTLARTGQYLFVCNRQGGVHRVSVADSANPRRSDHLTTYDCRHAAASGQYLYLADGYDGLRVVALAAPVSPTQVAVDPSMPAYSLTVFGDHVIAGNADRLRIYGRGSGDTLSVLGERSGGASVFGAVGRFVLGSDDDGLCIYDTTDPSAPTPAGSVASQELLGASLVGDYVYLTEGSRGLRVVDISDLDAPIEIWRSPSTAAYQAAVRNDALYMADQQAGLWIVDVVSPAEPSIEQIMTEGWDSGGWGLGSVSESRLLVGDYTRTWIADTSSPGSLVLMGWVPCPMLTFDIDPCGAYAVLAHGADGVAVVYFHEGGAAERVTLLPIGCSSGAVSGRYAYLAGYATGVFVVDLLGP